MNDHQLQLLNDAQRILVIQAENPDGDSLGSALALEDILEEMGKKVSLHCPVNIPGYLRYAHGWDRVTTDYDDKTDLVIIVDTLSETLISKILNIPGARHHLETRPVLAFDHHASVESTLPFPHELVIDPNAVATGELIYSIAKARGWQITPHAAECLAIAILSDSLGLTSAMTTAKSIHTVASLVELGAHTSEIESRRRELMKKAPEILAYKGELIGRIEYHLDGKLALVHIPWEDIQKYSDRYNPSVLVLDEMRLVTGVEVAVAIKTYPDGKLTGKLRCNKPVADKIAGYFGAGGHAYAAGFRVYDDYSKILGELVECVDKVLREEGKSNEAI